MHQHILRDRLRFLLNPFLSLITSLLMRIARIKPKGRDIVYHCVSRIVGGQFLLGNVEKESFRRMMWTQAEFCGVEIVAYCLMSNHVHLLVRVPKSTQIDDRSLLNRVTHLYGAKSTLTKRLKNLLETTKSIPSGQRNALLARMGDISVFNKELKQRFSTWYNRRNGRFGTLWAERFRSTIVEGVAETMRIVAAYIDLNPVRAGLVTDPKDYRFCSYAEALSGGQKSQNAIMGFYPSGTWQRISSSYREYLFVKGGLPGHSKKIAMERGAILREIKAGARLSAAQLLRLKIRYFSDGLALGSTSYINKLFDENRNRFGPRKRTGAHSLPPALERLNVTTLNKLKNEPIS